MKALRCVLLPWAIFPSNLALARLYMASAFPPRIAFRHHLSANAGASAQPFPIRYLATTRHHHCSRLTSFVYPRALRPLACLPAFFPMGSVGETRGLRG